jgi:NAD(P)-dependent dehydrogenase (short-subunit alcohol dehydrogenase family)
MQDRTEFRGIKGKVAIVTGAGQGIGEAYAKAIAAQGASVVVADINEAQGSRVASEIAKAGGKTLFVKVDVSSVESTLAMAEATKKEFGGIDFLVNNAAIYHGMEIAPLIAVDWDYYRRFMDVNMNGALLCIRACFESMASRGGGSIINQSSTAAWMSMGFYGIAKLALNGITQSVAREIGQFGIRVNAIAPGPTDTEATRTVAPEQILKQILATMPLPRMGSVDDLVGTCLFLLSDEAAWLTGQIVNVDGGQIMRP